MYIQLISIHGLIRGSRLEMGRDADTGGQVRYVLDLARTLSAFDEVTRIDLFTRRIRDKRVSPDYGRHIEEIGPKCRIVRLPCGSGRYLRKERLWPHLDDFADAMTAFTRRHGEAPALVHGHYADAGYVAREVAAIFGVPFVFTGHSLGRDKKAYLAEQGWTDEAMQREFSMDTRIRAEEACLAAADLVVASTRHERDAQYGRYDSGKNEVISVIPPGTDLDRFFPYYDYELGGEHITESFKQARVRMSNELKRFHFEPNKPLILALCRPDKRKNIHALVKAYGEDPELQALANLAIFAGIRKNIAEMEGDEQQVLTDILLMMDRYDLYGRMAVPKKHDSELEVPELYRLAASQRGVFVNPAYVEPFGLTFIESSAVGLPFVGTENGGPRDIKENCDSGLLVNVDDQQSITRALKRLITEHALWDRYSTNGINRVREHYTWEIHCRRYIDAIKSLVSEGPPELLQRVPVSDAYGRRMASLDKMLITDIDNTLIGDLASLEELRAVLEEHRDHVGFGVATGRYLESAREILDEHGLAGLTDLIISSVGTEIYYRAECIPDKGWASHLRAKWRRDRVLEALDPLPFLVLQSDERTQREFKVSYDLDEEFPAEEAIPAMHDALSKAKAAYTLVFSHGAFVDVLPHRASKGKAIRYLSSKWSIPLARIATAGDSGNDADMLRGPTAGIAVANHSQEIEALRNGSTRLYFAEASYAAGILEGLKHYRILERRRNAVAK